MYEIFERLCNERNVTVADVSRATGIGQSTLGSWKKRRNILSARHAQKIADYFGVSLQYLMTGKDDGTNVIAIPADQVSHDILEIIRDNPIIVEMIYDFADIDREHYLRLRGYYDAIVRNERRSKE